MYFKQFDARTDLLHFDSLADQIRWNESTPIVEGASESSRTTTAKASWDLRTDLVKANAMAAGGGRWASGAKKMRKGVASIAPASAPAPIMALGYAVAGGIVDVPEMLSGAPLHMLAPDLESAMRVASHPIVRIGCMIIASCSTESDAMVNRGIGILSVVDSLEASGYRCEITAVWIGDAGSRHIAETVVKRADAQWNPQSAAFTLAHPAFCRRLGFATCERSPNVAKDVTNSSYGNARGQGDYWDNAGFDVAFPEYINGGERQYQTIASATAYATTRAKAYIEGEDARG